MALLVLIAIASLVVILTLVGWTQYIHAQMRRYGHIPVLWRWFSGALPHSVRNEQDRRYRAQYDPSSQHYHIKARAHRALIRTGFTFGIPVLPIAILLNIPLAWYTLFIIGGALVLEAAWRIWKAEKVRQNRRTIRNVGRAAAPFANQPVRAKTGQWIKFTDDKRQTIRAQFPKNWNPSEQQRSRFIQVVTETAGFHPNSDVEWRLEGDESHAIIKNRVPPPPAVTLADILPHIERNNPDTITLGLGRGNEPVNVSLAEDSPHFGLSIGSGGGKSELAKVAASQVLRGGGNVLILDPKRISHAWAKGLPNVRYARSTEEIHAALVWLDEEINRRTDVADRGHDVEGEVLANVGARILVIAEELNEMMARLRAHWMNTRTNKQPKKSPAIAAMESALFMGRQVKINIFAVAQMMTALAAGSGAARENMGVRILGRYSRNNWRMLVPEFDMPQRSMRPGRVQVVTHDVTECQVALMSGAEARELSLSGVIREFPRDENSEPALPPGDDEIIEGEIVESETSSTTRELVRPEVSVEVEPRKKATLREAAGKCVPRSIKGLTNARDRYEDFPKHCGVREDLPGHPKEYWLDELIAWDKKKRSQNV